MLIRRLLGTLLVLLAASLISYPLYLQIHYTDTDRQLSKVSIEKGSKLSREELRKARDYNARLAKSGQARLGGDPFTSPQTASEDVEYMDMLNADDPNVMATVSYPKLGIALRIGHGTSREVLEHMAGHMIGTSLPVGGASTHSVISAHRGDPTHLLFTRLDEAKKDDPFYIYVAGKVLAYKVKSIKTIDPDDFDALRIVDKKDLVTLMTCTPYGVNTHRLLITGQRAEVPNEVPYEKDVKHEDNNFNTYCILGLIWLVTIVTLIYGWRKTKTKPEADVQKMKVSEENRTYIAGQEGVKQ